MEHEVKQKQNDRALFGFWFYILSDCVLFAGLFATYAVLRGATFGGPTAEDLLNLPYVFWETVMLLTSNLMMGFATLQKNKNTLLYYLAASLVLGLIFLGLEINEFHSLVLAGNGPHTSAFLSSFFALVGTHGLHVALGSLWMISVMWRIYAKGVEVSRTRLQMLALFWHFLDIVWIFIFSIVYLLSATL